jgi:glutamyl-tRNA reductase
MILVSISESDIGEDFEGCALDRLKEELLRNELLKLKEACTIDEAVVVATCARSEVYLSAPRFHATVDDVAAAFASVLGRDISEIEKQARVSYGKPAIRHLLRVASGLESAIVGESEILAQLKSALVASREAGLVESQMNRIFEHAFEIAKRVRTETSISNGNVSVVSMAAKIATSSCKEMCSVGVVGTGNIGSEVARVLLDRGVRVSVVTSRPERLNWVREELSGAEGRSMEELPDLLPELDALVLATSVDSILIGPSMVEGLRGLRIVDLCRPRSTDPSLAELDKVSLFDLDAVNRLVAAQLAERYDAVTEAEAIIEAELAGFEELARRQEFNPLLAQLFGRAEEIRRSEIDRMLGRLNIDDERLRAEIEELTHRIVAKILHDPASAIRKRANAADFSKFLEDFKTIFDL